MTGAFLELGPAVVWMRMRHPLVEGEEPTPLQRVLVAADSGNGVSAALDYRRYLFINTDLTVHLHRRAGDRVGLPRRRDPPGFGRRRHVRHRAVGRARAHRTGRSDAARTPTGVTFRAKGYAPNVRTKLGGCIAALSALALVGTAVAHELDHASPGFSEAAPLSTNVNAGGENAQWELIGTIPTGNPHTDLDFFTSDGITYASVGTLAAGANAAGQTIISLTNADGEVDPHYVFGHPSATCPGIATGVTGLQHDAEAAPKGRALVQFPNPYVDTRDTQIVLDATDAPGRCHDQGDLAIQARQERRARDHRRDRSDGPDRDRPHLARRRGAHRQRRPEAPAHRVRVELGRRALRRRRHARQRGGHLGGDGRHRGR